MSGKKGMLHANLRRGAARYRIWQSMRILHRFTVPDLCRTASAGESNVKKFIKNLSTHGYVAKHGYHIAGRLGIYQTYRMVLDVGPEYPLKCDRCGGTITGPCQNKEIS